MTTFWIIAGVLAVVASLFVAWPLLRRGHARGGFGDSGSELNVSIYRDQLAELGEDRRAGRLGADQYDQARGELERRLLEDVPDGDARAGVPARRRALGAAVAAGVTMPVLAVLLYLALGNPAALGARQGAAEHDLGQQQIDAMIGRLAARLEKNPQDGKGWAMLARSQAALGRFGEASSAYARSVAIIPDDAQLLADYADTLAMASGGRLQGEPEKLIERALRADPDNGKALALAGTIAFDNRDFALAVKHWERLRSLIPPDSEFAKSVQASIDEAKNLSGARDRIRQTASAPGRTQAPARR